MPRIRADSIAEHKAKTRADILDAAGRLFNERGLAETTLADIAAAAQIGRTTMYQYFADKTGLLAALVERRVPARIDETLAAAGDEEGLGWLVTFGRRSLEQAAEAADIAGLLLAHREMLDAESAGEALRAIGDAGTLIEKHCRLGVANGSILDADPVETAAFVKSLLRHTVGRLLAAPSPRDALTAVASSYEAILRNALAPEA